MTRTCFFFLKNVLNVSSVKCTTSDGSSLHGVSGGGGGGGSRGSRMNSVILAASLTFTSNANSPSLKYLSVGYPRMAYLAAIAACFVTSRAAAIPTICRDKAQCYYRNHQQVTKCILAVTNCDTFIVTASRLSNNL